MCECAVNHGLSETITVDYICRRALLLPLRYVCVNSLYYPYATLVHFTTERYIYYIYDDASSLRRGCTRRYINGHNAFDSNAINLGEREHACFAFGVSSLHHPDKRTPSFTSHRAHFHAHTTTTIYDVCIVAIATNTRVHMCAIHFPYRWYSVVSRTLTPENRANIYYIPKTAPLQMIYPCRARIAPIVAPRIRESMYIFAIFPIEPRVHPSGMWV